MSDSLESQLQRAYRYAAKGDREGWQTTLSHSIVEARKTEQELAAERSTRAALVEMVDRMATGYENLVELD